MDVVNFFFLDLAKPTCQLLYQPPTVHDFTFKSYADFYDLSQKPGYNFSVSLAFSQSGPKCMQDRRVSENNLQWRFLLRCKVLAFLWDKHPSHLINRVP